MPAKTRKRKASEEEGDEAEEIPQAAKKTSRTTQRKPRVNQEQPSKVGESSRRGRAGLSSLAASNTLKKSKSASSSAKSAKSEIRRNADNLIHMIEDQYNNAHRSGISRGNTLSSKISAILQDGLDTQNIVHQKSHDRIKTLQHTLDEYEAANRDSIKVRKPTEGAQWERDAKDVFKVDKKAMELLIQMLNGLVISGEHAKSLRSPRSSDDIEQAAWRWIEGGIPPADDTWGSSAQQTLKAFAGVAKLLL